MAQQSQNSSLEDFRPIVILNPAMTLLADNIAGITRKEMAAPLCCSERTLKRVLPRLERAGVIVPLVDGAGTRPTIYRTQDLPVIARHLRFPSPLSDVAFWPQKGK